MLKLSRSAHEIRTGNRSVEQSPLAFSHYSACNTVFPPALCWCQDLTIREFVQFLQIAFGEAAMPLERGERRAANERKG